MRPAARADIIVLAHKCIKIWRPSYREDVWRPRYREDVTYRFSHCYSIIPSLLPCQRCTIVELNRYEQFRYQKEKLKICRQLLTSSTQPHDRSFHCVARTRKDTRCANMKGKNARSKRVKPFPFIVKYANLWCSSSWDIRSLSTRRFRAKYGNQKWAVFLFNFSSYLYSLVVLLYIL